MKSNHKWPLETHGKTNSTASVVKLGSKSCPLVIRSPKTHVNTSFDRGHICG